MPVMFHLLGLLSVLSSIALKAAAEDTVTSIDFYTDVLYQPSTAWHATLNDPCGTVDHYTTATGANITVQFTGNKIVVDGMRNSASGFIQVAMDDAEPFVENLFSQDVQCGVFFEYDVGNGTHTLTVTLMNIDASGVVNEGTVQQPVLHLTGITYWTPQPGDASVSVTSFHHTDVGAIVGAVVCSVIGAILLGGVLFWYMRRRKARRVSSSRHVYDPTSCFTELSPRSPTSASSFAKFQAYARMDDDMDVKSGHLEVPPPAYTVSTKGLRARSRSPDPDRKSMA